ncbi:MAG: hypothetical protein ABJK46_01585 [Ekhidna sp.]
MTDDHEKDYSIKMDIVELRQMFFEVATRQHEYYIDKTVIALRSPIYMILSLNGFLIASIIFIARVEAQNGIEYLVASAKSGLALCSLSIITLIAASYFQWGLYSYLADRKRQLLGRMRKVDSIDDAIRQFVNEPEIFGPTNLHKWCVGAALCGLALSLLAGYVVLNAFLITGRVD